MDLRDYTQKKTELTQYLQRLQILASDLNLKNQARDMAHNILQLGQESFELAVVGEFSRGKSTFVNAMLGHRILPSSKKPTTTVISKIVYGDQPSYEIVYKSGKTKYLNESEFLKLTAPKEANERDLMNWKKYLGLKEDINKIDYAIVAYPLDFCRDNVEIVDTPGINDINTGRVDITYRYVNRADAIIMVLAANQILTASEREFLEQRIQNNQISDIFFVINFKDELKTEMEEQEAVAFAREHLQKMMHDLDRPLRLFLLSSKQALVYRRVNNGETLKPSITKRYMPSSLTETGFPGFESALAKFLSDEKGAIKLRKYIHRGIAGAEMLEKDLLTRIEVSKHSADEIQQKIAEMEPVFQKSQRDAKRIISNMKTNLYNIKNNLENTCLESNGNTRYVIKQAVDDYKGEWSSKAISQAVGRVMARERTKLIDDLRKQEESALTKEFGRTQVALNKIWSDIDADYQHNLNLPAVLAKKNEEINVELNLSSGSSGTNIDLDAIISSAGIGAIIGGIIGGAAFPLMVIGGLLGFFASNDSSSNNETEDSEAVRERQKAKLKKDLYKHYAKEANKVADTVLEQYDETVDVYCEKIEQNVTERIEDMQGQLQEIMKQKQRKEQDAEQEQHRLEQMLQEVKKVREQLNVKAVEG